MCLKYRTIKVETMRYTTKDTSFAYKSSALSASLLCTYSLMAMHAAARAVRNAMKPIVTLTTNVSRS